MTIHTSNPTLVNEFFLTPFNELTQKLMADFDISDVIIITEEDILHIKPELSQEEIQILVVLQRC